MLSNVYSKSYLQSSPDMAALSQEILHIRLFPALESLVGGRRSIDILELNFALGMDFITTYLFGLANGSNFTQDETARRDYLYTFHSRNPYRFWSAELPEIVSLLRKCKVELIPKWVDNANRLLEESCLKMGRAAESLSKLSASVDPSAKPASTTPVVYNHLAQSISTPTRQVSQTAAPKHLQIASEVLDQLGAGFETTGISLTYCCYEISQRPKLQTSLRAELLSLSPPLHYPSREAVLPSPRSIDSLPVLHAILMETLRLHPAIPGPQPRVTPAIPTSLVGSPPLPAGVRVSANAYCLHRNDAVFPDANTWQPERWLTGSKAKKDEMMRWFWAFGSGGRMCIGSNFAMQGIYPC